KSSATACSLSHHSAISSKDDAPRAAHRECAELRTTGVGNSSVRRTRRPLPGGSNGPDPDNHRAAPPVRRWLRLFALRLPRRHRDRRYPGDYPDSLPAVGPRRRLISLLLRRPDTTVLRPSRGDFLFLSWRGLGQQ